MDGGLGAQREQSAPSVPERSVNAHRSSVNAHRMGGRSASEGLRAQTVFCFHKNFRVVKVGVTNFGIPPRRAMLTSGTLGAGRQHDAGRKIGVAILCGYFRDSMGAASERW